MELLALQFLNGISYGMVLFLIASGLSLILGVMGIINLAHGSLYLLGAYIGLTLVPHVGNFWLAAILGGLAVGLVGVAIERGLLSRFHGRFNEQAVLTVGLVYILANLFLWIWGAYMKTGTAPSWLAGSVGTGALSFSAYRFALIFIGLVIFAGLWWFQKKTRAGAIVRAGMDDKQMVTGLGINYGLICSAIFFLGAFVGGGCGFIAAPWLGAEPNMAWPILVLALIAVVIGGVGTVQGTLLGAIVVGLIHSFSKGFIPQFELFTPYIAFIIILMVRPAGLLGREQIRGRAPPAAPVIVPKRAAARAPGQAWQRRLVSYAPYIIAGIILIAVFPVVPAYAQIVLTQTLIFGIFAMSLNLLMGYTGLFSLGHAAFFGVGAYTSAILITKFGITSFWLAAPAGILMVVLVAAVFGIIVLRAAGIYFMFITMALAELLVSVALKWRPITGGSLGIVGIGYPDLGLGFTMNETSFYYFVLVILAICAFLMYRLVNSPFGHALQGIREDERLMQHLGYNTWLYKYIAFIIAGLFAGVAGILFGHLNSIVVPGHLAIMISATVVVMVIIGSSSTVFGPILGAAVVLFIQYYASIYTPARWPMILGGVFVLAIMFLRGGVSIYLLRLWDRIGSRLGSRYGSTEG